MNFQRLPGQVSFETVLARPRVDEQEDYKEYKRLRSIEYSKKEKEMRQQTSTDAVPAVDGMIETAFTQLTGNQMLPHTKDGPLWPAEMSPEQEKPARAERLSAHDVDRTRHDPDPSTTLPPVHWVQGMQADWWMEPPRQPQVQTVPEHQKLPSDAEIAGQVGK